MAAYASVTNIQEEFKNVTFDSNSIVTDTRVSRFIDECEAVINAKVGMIYQVPVDSVASPQSTLILRQISIYMVSNRIKEIIQTKSDSDDTNQATKGKVAKSPEDLLQDILDKVLVLPDAVLLSTTKGATDYDVGDATVEFAFKRATGRYGGPNQW